MVRTYADDVEPMHKGHSPGAPLPLALPSLLHHSLSDPDDVPGAVADAAPIEEFRSLVPRQYFYQQYAHQPMKGAVLLSSFSGADASFVLRQTPDLHLVVCVTGQRRVSMRSGTVQCHGGGCLLLPPGDRSASGGHSAAIFTIAPAAVAATASVMAGGTTMLGRFAPQAIEPGPLASLLHHLVSWIDHCFACDPALPDYLGAGDTVLRQVAAVLDPSLVGATRRHPAPL